MDEAAGDEMEVPLIRYNLNAIELNEEGFEKLSSEIALAPMVGNLRCPGARNACSSILARFRWGIAQPIIVRKGFIRQLLPGRKSGRPASKAYYEVCTDARCWKSRAKSFPRLPRRIKFRFKVRRPPRDRIHIGNCVCYTPAS